MYPSAKNIYNQIENGIIYKHVITIIIIDMYKNTENELPAHNYPDEKNTYSEYFFAIIVEYGMKVYHNRN